MIHLLDSVSKVLYDKFGPNIEIYRDAVTMGTDTPCFFIKVLEPSIQPEANRLWTLTIPLDVHYFPADERDTTGDAPGGAFNAARSETSPGCE